MISKDQIIKSLSYIKDLQFNKSIVEFIQDIVIQNNILYISFEYDEQILRNNLDEKERLIAECEQIIKKDFKGFQPKISLTAKQVSKKNVEKKKINSVKKMILVASGKGGVGKSMLSANLALAFDRGGYKTALADADIYGPSIPQMFNIFDKPDLKNNLMQPHIRHNIKLISMGFLIDPNRAAIWRGPMITKALNQLLMMTDWAYDGVGVDVLVIDTPPGTGDIILSLCEYYAIDQVVLISTPQMIALNDVRKAHDMFIKLGINVSGIVENMSYIEVNGEKSYIFGRHHVQDFAASHSIPFLGQIPIITDITHSCDNGLGNTVAQTKIFDEIVMKLF